jgi:hypothetical protein
MAKMDGPKAKHGAMAHKEEKVSLVDLAAYLKRHRLRPVDFVWWRERGAVLYAERKDDANPKSG